ncbi:MULTISPECIES: glycosyltransferase family 4 protein [unclassified Rhizobium]|uniref:glycosyltransferase family 4 protein n=1 Tax=unclassified Rhizobium TaxID=2613769 RepID=UPI0007128B8D|nr:MULTISPECIES: glycosyltransferase family 4 protein [unclassified Rhizobium]KQS93918.1 glycosyl transferase [Rhizobium sp. Leaf386]KQT06565.1 glycosyl transferase [Rhizobium sp. Leaf391]KQU04994.1 glycosyl transferase [Rhizobium sp. Leaf453]
MPDPRPLRIIHCFRSPVGGIFRHVRDLAEAQAKVGHQVGILCDSTTGGDYEDKLFDEIRPFLSLGLVRLPIRRSIGIADAAALYRSYKEIRSLRPDILHGHGAKGGVLSRIIGSALRVNRYCVARIYSPHGGSLHYDRKTFSGKMVFVLERFQEIFTDAIVFVCDFERDTYIAKVGKPRTRSERIYNGINDRDFEMVHARPDAVDFLYIGMLRDLKGPDLFIDAFAKTERIVGRPLSAMMIGDGPQKAEYEQMMLERGLGRRIEMLPAMKARDAFSFTRNVVVPSRAESMPYIVLEALAGRKPVIASRVGGIPEVLGAENPALVPPDDAAALATAMTNALTDPNWAARVMPEAAGFKAKFSTSTMADGITRLYHDIVPESARP